jgi:hypothetical protein
VADGYYHAHPYAHTNADGHLDAAAHPHALVD